MALRKVVMAALIVVLAAPAVPALAAPSVPAARTPVIYTDGMGPAWGGPARRPHGFTLGADYGVDKMTWARWTNSGARGNGHLVACAGATGPCIKYHADVTLSRVRIHHRTRYFSAMTITGKHRKPKHLVMRNGIWTQVHP
jgi:transcription elongation factor